MDLPLSARYTTGLKSRPHIAATASSLALAGATAVLGLGLAVLVIGALRPPISAYESLALPMMVPATASGLVLGAASLLLLHRLRTSDDVAGASRALLFARLAALVCATIGLAAIFAFVQGGGLPTAEVSMPGYWTMRPAPNTGLNLFFTGLALLALGAASRGMHRLGRRLAALVLVVSLLALVGHAYGAGVLQGLNRLSGMSAPTAFAFGILAFGILFFDTDRGIASIFVSDSTGGRLLRRLAPAAVLVPPLLGWLRLAAEELGLIDDAFGLTLFVVTLVVVFAWLLINQGSALHAFDIERMRLHAAERGARAEAEAAQHVAERARREADEANQAKSVFLATMSHEIRTPINAIVGYGQLMELGVAGPVTPQQHDYLARMGATSEHLRGVVDDVLDLAKIDAGGMSVAQEVSVTGPLVASALDLVRPQASAKGVRLVDNRLDEPGEPFVGDEHRVRQILANLLSNAVKFTDVGGTITIDCCMMHEAPLSSALRANGPWTAVRVLDTGIGISNEQRQSIFAPFHQVERGNTRKQGGTGLGLTISRRLARLMGGDLTVESTPGEGSIFTLWLPAAHMPPRESHVAAPSTRSAASAARRVHGLAEIGMHLRERVEEVLAAYAARIRGDLALPHAAHLRRSELEDHQLSFLSDIAQTLVVVEETGGADSDLLRDGSTIQRVVAELHGAMRQRRGWTVAQLEHEYGILDEEIAAVVRRRVPEGTGDVSLALDVLQRLVQRARDISIGSLRRTAEEEEDVEETQA